MGVTDGTFYGLAATPAYSFGLRRSAGMPVARRMAGRPDLSPALDERRHSVARLGTAGAAYWPGQVTPTRPGAAFGSAKSRSETPMP